MGLAKHAISTEVSVPPSVIFDIPEHWSMAEAASVPTVYMTCYLALVMRGQLRAGMRVLVHSGTGAVGLAAIQICLTRGAEVMAASAGGEYSNAYTKTLMIRVIMYNRIWPILSGQGCFSDPLGEGWQSNFQGIRALAKGLQGANNVF